MKENKDCCSVKDDQSGGMDFPKQEVMVTESSKAAVFVDRTASCGFGTANQSFLPHTRITEADSSVWEV